MAETTTQPAREPTDEPSSDQSGDAAPRRARGATAPDHSGTESDRAATESGRAAKLISSSAVMAAGTAFAIATGHLFVGLVLLGLAAIPDLLDGAVAKASGPGTVASFL